MRGHLSSMLTLARWLGPWTPEDVRPRAVRRRGIVVADPSGEGGGGDLDAWMYEPAHGAPLGAILLVPGLHFLGPADPRFDRFASILANAGLLVLTPFLPTYLSLRLDAGVLSDVQRAYDVLLKHERLPRGVRPGIFSISFGSLPALRLAAHPQYAGRVGGVMVFGGYADWRDSLRFSLEGTPGQPRDPLNQPVAFINLLEHMPNAPDAPELAEAWVRFMRATWGRPEMKERARHEPVARRLAAELDPELHEVFLVGCGILPGGLERCLAALERLDGQDAHLDPREHLHGVRCPVHLVHGLDDDVIPHWQLELLRGAFPPHVRVEAHLTGLYGHSGHAGAGFGGIAALGREGATLVRVLRGLVQVATARD